MTPRQVVTWSNYLQLQILLYIPGQIWDIIVPADVLSLNGGSSAGMVIIDMFKVRYISSRYHHSIWSTRSREIWRLFGCSWWRHQMETFSALLAICAGNSPVTGEFPSQRPVTQSFDVFFDLRLNKQLSKQSWGCRFETPSRSLLSYCNVTLII